MSTLTAILIGVVIGLLIGFTLGILLLRNQIGNRITYEIEKLRAKKGAVIDVDQDNATTLPEPKKRKKLFKRKSKT